MFEGKDFLCILKTEIIKYQVVGKYLHQTEPF